MRLELPIVAALVSLTISALLTPQVKRLALRLGAVDEPDDRKVHQVKTPRMGGLAIVSGFGLTFAALLVWGGWNFNSEIKGSLLGFGAGALIISAVGVLDDLKGLGAKFKLLGQFVAAVAAWYGGAQIQETVNAPFWGPVHIGPTIAFALTVVWILAFVNAINLVDGLDGLAGGIAFFATLTNLVVAFVTHNLLAAVLNASLAGAVLGFLRYNFNPARIFMGDTGSLFLGYALSAGALLSTRQKESTLASLLVVIIALGLPLADTVLSMLRRVLRRRSIFSADKEHLHHRLLELGLTHRRAVLVLYGCTAALSAVAVLAAIGQEGQVGMALLGAILVLSGVMRFSGYFQNSLVRGEPPLESRALLLAEGLPGFSILAHEAASQDQALQALATRLEQSGLQSVSIANAEGETIFDWATDEPESSRRVEGRLIRSSFPIRSEEQQVGSLTVRMYSSRAAPPPELSILFHFMTSMLSSLGARFGWWNNQSTQAIQGSTDASPSSSQS